MNDRKNKILYQMWLEEDEERFLLDCLEKEMYSIAWTIIKEAFKRGDFIRK